MSMSPVFRFRVLYGVVGVLCFAIGFFLFPQQSARSPAAENSIGGAFKLTNGDGEVITESVFADKPYALMFGFANCPDICPTGLSRMRAWRELLGEKRDDMRFAFATVDPARDKPALLARYVSFFSDAIIPLSGTPTQVAALLKTYRVYAEKVSLENGGYTMDHHSAVFLFDADGRFVEFIYYDDDRQTAMKKLNRLLSGEAPTAGNA